MDTTVSRSSSRSSTVVLSTPDSITGSKRKRTRAESETPKSRDMDRHTRPQLQRASNSVHGDQVCRIHQMSDDQDHQLLEKVLVDVTLRQIPQMTSYLMLVLMPNMILELTLILVKAQVVIMSIATAQLDIGRLLHDSNNIYIVLMTRLRDVVKGVGRIFRTTTSIAITSAQQPADVTPNPSRKWTPSRLS
ncbi:hypothetical protein LTR05_005833 [Lithohypha guttulata]|uniref:Uncharacterized protein n=1 Tax=Lithohypha guttulata TaxID=1690604 RepID=A0AAN7SYF0_9EURO|nr:hypothetical protein LTR05_005833 [Lithohypha guttulata]